MIERDPHFRPLILTGAYLTRLIRSHAPDHRGYRDLITGLSVADYRAIRENRKRITGDTEAGLMLEDVPKGGSDGMG